MDENKLCVKKNVYFPFNGTLILLLKGVKPKTVNGRVNHGSEVCVTFWESTIPPIMHYWTVNKGL